MSAESINAQDKEKRTALHYAVRRKDKETAIAVSHKLLDKGADPTLQTGKNKRTPAHRAAVLGNTKYVQYVC